MANNKQLKIALTGLTLLVAVVILGISVATLVKVFEKPKAAETVKDNGGGKGGNGGNGDNGLPNKPNIVNVPPAVTVSSQSKTYNSFKAYAKSLKESVNTSVDPCQDFFTYSCGNYKQQMSFNVVQNNNMLAIAKHARKPQTTTIGKQTAYHFTKCVEANKDPKQIHQDGQTIRDIYSTFKDKTKITFPLFEQNWSGDFPTGTQLGQAMGYLVGAYGVNTFVSLGVDTNWKHPSDKGVYSYELYIDQTQLAFADTYYIKAWDVIKEDYKNKTYALLKAVAKNVGATVDQNQMEQDVKDIFTMEYEIANNISTREAQRRIYERQINQKTIPQASIDYPLLDFSEYLNNGMLYASQEAKKVVTNTPGYLININEPDQLKKLSDYLKTKVKPRTIYNYLFFRLLRSQQAFMPESYSALADRWMLEDRHVLGRRGAEKWRRLPRKHPSEANDDSTQIDLDCAEENAGGLWYSNARFFVEELLPTKDQRDGLKSNVAMLVSSVLEGFQNQLDQLDWMADSTKNGAYSKIKFLVRNIAYPETILDDTWLDNYYKDLDFSTTDTYLNIMKSINVFLNRKQFEVLTLTTGTIRDDFGGPPSIVNAWYQPEMNSITFPLGILQQPFYDINYPAAVNFGAMGVVAGHELTHGFDDEGVQWDGFGKLNNWIDDNSKKSFDTMAQCVDDQYSKFSPTPGFTVDGRQTLGENLADNGGIRAAYNAFEAHQNYWGPDARLPDSQYDAFTPEQLFFLGFARVWCETNPSPERLQRQVLIDPHSPSQFRVLGTIQNFPAFRSAFNCPAGSNYGPNEHCNVWASEVQVVTGIPPVDVNQGSDKVNNVNPAPEKDTEPYKKVANRLKAAINVSTQPCDDFLTYACGKFDQNAPSAVKVAHKTVRDAALIQLSTNSQDSDPTYLALAKSYLTQCKAYDKTRTEYVQNMVLAVESLLDQPFPTFSADPKTKPLDPTKLGKAFGAMWSVYHTEPFVSMNVKSLHQHYYSERPNAIYLDQPKLTFDVKWYTGAQKDDLKGILKTYIINVLTRFRDFTSRTLDDKVIEQDAQDLVDYEFRLATDFLKNEYTRVPDFKRIRFEEVMRGSNAINVSVYLHYIMELTGAKYNTDLQTALLEQDWVLEAPKYLKKLDKELTNVASSNKRRTIYNYIFYKLLDTNQIFLEGDKPPPFPKKPTKKDDICGEAVNLQFAPVYSRAAISQLYKDISDFQTVQQNVAEIADDVQNGFITMIETLSWLPLSARKQAILKIQSIVRNIGVPDFVLDDTKLNAYYADLSFTNPTDFVSMVLDLKKFARRKQLEKLTQKQKVERNEFLFNLYPDPIWSAYDLNSITFTLDVLQEPMYSKDYPSALNFGLLGSLIGHELGHAFDFNGIMFDKNGQLKPWLDTTNPDYIKMTQCLNKQYADYCPANPNDPKACLIDADDTENDNLADNTGLQVAVRGFLNWINQHGKDPRLADSDKVLDRFTNEQLFFLGYAQQYCPRTDFYMYNFGAKQSPNEYRLLGTLSNSKTFRSAFNCPAGKKYAPTDMCEVWTSEDTNSNLGVPDLGTERPPLNIPENSRNYSAGYLRAAKILEDTIDTRVNPCDDFYGYVCRRYKGPGTFSDVLIENQGKLIKKLKDPSSDPKSLRASGLERNWFNKCPDALHNWLTLNKDSYMIKTLITSFEAAVNQKFPLANSNPANPVKITPQILGQALGYLQRNFENLQPLVNYFVFNDFVHPELGYKMYIDAPSLVQDTSLYLDPDFDTKYRQKLVNLYVQLFQLHFSGIGINVDANLINQEAQQLVLFESILAQGQGDSGPQTDGDTYNPMTLKNATDYFPKAIDLTAFLTELAKGIDGLDKKILNPDYELVFNWPKGYYKFAAQLATCGDRINDNTIWNYLFLRIIVSKLKYLPGQQINYYELHQKPAKPAIFEEPKIKRKVPPIPDWHPVMEELDFTRNELFCSLPLGNKFTEIHNRLFVEAVFPNEGERNDTRKQIAQYAEMIGISFRGMVNQLTWLTKESKKGAYNKLDLFVRNMLYPNQTFDDNFLEDYYKDLVYDETMGFLDMQITIGTFLRGKELLDLNKTTPADRTVFGDTSQVNAFYRPTANSITICAGITQPPFYDKSWPAAMNYGAIGLVVGHEITHGFDNGGVYWDGIGAYNPWLDDSSKKGFDDMAQCVIDEYNKKPDFCMDPQHCVDGEITQGENIADNGGIQSAFRAYRAHVGLYGEDPALPGDIVGQLTNDQLFFVGFTRNWCEDYYQSPDNYYWEEAHSPGPYRIFGTLQNFDEFRSAFNCPVGSKYYVKDNCPVWISDVEAHLAVPEPEYLPPSINIPAPAVAGTDNQKYNEVATYFSDTLDVSQKPCDNFYEYTCSKLKSKPTNAQLVNRDAAKAIVDALPGLDTSKRYYQIIKDFHAQCSSTLNKAPDAEIINNFIGALKTATNVGFPLFDGQPAVAFTKDSLATTIGYLSGTQAINTLIDAQVIQNLGKTAATDSNYILNIGEPLLTQPAYFYSDQYRSVMQGPVLAAFRDVLTVYRDKILTGSTVTDQQINAAAQELFNIEYAIAARSRSQADRSDPTKTGTQVTVNDLQTQTKYNFLNWQTFFQKLTENVGSNPFTTTTLKVNLAAPDQIANVFAAVVDTTQITSNALANYFNFRTLWDLRTSLFQAPDDGSGDLPILGSKDTLNSYICALETRALNYLHSNVYVKQAIGLDKVDALKSSVSKVANRVIGELKSQVLQTNWLNDNLKQNAVDKFDSIVLNVVVDPNAVSDQFLTSFYQDLNYGTPTSASVLDGVRKFTLKKEFSAITSTGPVSRDDFVGSSSDSQPVYDSLTNSLSIPASLAQKPFFDDGYPLASNFAGLGYLVAHELAHSFDSFGIWFNKNGQLQNQLNDTALVNFNAMTDCLTKQYSAICPLPDGAFTQKCLDGALTLNENVADNAGVHAAYSAFLASRNYAGSDARLNSPILGQFTENQLFFLGYAREFCAQPLSNDGIEATIVSGSNPPNLRIKAALRNYPAFKSAFNCPSNTEYAPDKKDVCNVWLTESSDVARQ